MSGSYCSVGSCFISGSSLFHRVINHNIPHLFLQDSDVLSLGISSHHSWWKDNGPGCDSESLPSAWWKNQHNPELTTVLSCWLEYQYIEILHCIVQLLISVSVLCLCWTPHSCLVISKQLRLGLALCHWYIKIKEWSIVYLCI